MIKLRWFLLTLYFISIFLITVYTYTQGEGIPILFKNTILGSAQEFLYRFWVDNKTLVGIWFFVSILMSFFSYCLILKFFNFSKKQLILVVVGLSIVSMLATPTGFSRDVFNYLFDGKILSHYQQIPWFTSPSQFPNDPWLKFVPWPTSTSRYGPVWLILMGMITKFSGENLLINLAVFKVVMTMFLFGNVWWLWKISKLVDVKPENTLRFIIFNPLFIIETLISPHTDAVMTFFVLGATYFLLSLELSWRKSLILLLLSSLVKIVSLPLLIAWVIFPVMKNFNKQYFLTLLVVFSCVASAIISLRWSINPWYFTLPIVLTALVLKKPFFRNLAICLSLALLVRYVPFVFLGYFDPENKIRFWVFMVTLTPMLLWSILIARRFVRLQLKQLEK